MTMRISLTALQKMKQDGERIAMLTAYDASFAAVVDAAGVDTILIGDSLGMVIQGHDTTLPVTQRDAVYHTACVARVPIQVANDSLSQMSFHQRRVTRLPNQWCASSWASTESTART